VGELDKAAIAPAPQYVIQNEISRNFFTRCNTDGSFQFSADINKAGRFPSVRRAVAAIQIRGPLAGSVTVLRLTETEEKSGESAVEVSTPYAGYDGPVDSYVIFGAYCREYLRPGTGYHWGELAEARRFPTISAAVSGLGNEYTALGKVELHRVHSTTRTVLTAVPLQ
jgi:hypothetical protein